MLWILACSPDDVAITDSAKPSDSPTDPTETAATGVDSTETDATDRETAPPDSDPGETGAPTETAPDSDSETTGVVDYSAGDGPWTVTETDNAVDGQDVTWFEPVATEPLGVIVWSHGFSRAKEQHASAARRAASYGFVVVTPNLPNWSDHEANGEWLADTLFPTALATAGVEAARGALVGHSAGGLASLVAASRVEAGAYVGLDPVDMSELGLDAAPAVTEPALILHGESSYCNSSANSGDWAPAGEAWQPTIVDAGHCDFESDSDWICELGCGSVDAGRQELVQAYALAWVVHHLVGGADDWVQGGAQTAADEAAGRLRE